jgi:ribulose 1,5-bisphosphate synthetase/thiazole synthase
MRTVREESRDIPVVADVDVVVAGGGPAGVAAATAAARLGARTLLVERYGHLGGLATGGLVLLMDDLFDRQGQRCIGGILWEAMERLKVIDGLAEERPTRLHADSELLKVVCDDLCSEAGVALRLHSWAVEAIVDDNSVKGVITESKSGRQAILAKVVVDATGDGDIAALAGAKFEKFTMRIGLNLKVGGVDLDAYKTFRRENSQASHALRQELEALGGYPMDCGPTPYSNMGVYWVNILGLANPEGTEPRPYPNGDPFYGELDAVDVETLSFAEVDLRRRIMIGLDFYKRNVPGYERVCLLSFASQLGVRDSRRITGAHCLTRAEMDAGVQFDDTIGMTGTTYRNGNHLEVPYRALVPAATDGLLTAGRCISVDSGLIHSIRLIPPAMMTGQAAGTAAALCVHEAVQPRELDTSQLRKQLEANDAVLPRVVEAEAI